MPPATQPTHCSAMPTPCTLLYAESNADLARQFQRRMEAHQIDAILAASDMAGISALSQHRVDLLVANYRLSGDNGLVVLRAARNSHPETAALLLVEPADLKHAGPALRDERFDYLVKDPDGVYLDMLPLMAQRLVSQQKQQATLDSLHQALEQAHALALEAAESNEHGLAIFGPDLRLRLCNARFLHHLDRPDALGAPGTALDELMGPPDMPGGSDGLPAQQRFHLERRSKSGLLLEICGSRGADGSLVLTCADISSRRQSGRPDWRQANIDALTGLPARPLFMELLKHQVHRASRSGYNSAALLLLDIDGFKLLNQTHGNDVCDLVLVEVARRLSETVRESDVVGRMDGDQFGVLAVDVNSSENVEIVAGKLLAAIARTFVAGNTEIRLTASIGIAFHPAEPRVASELVKMVEDAVSHAKAAGKNRYKLA
jgi:diguanylate cyclase (GGDEF)-like protein